jgi:hypothetical protein
MVWPSLCTPTSHFFLPRDASLSRPQPGDVCACGMLSVDASGRVVDASGRVLRWADDGLCWKCGIPWDDHPTRDCAELLKC